MTQTLHSPHPSYSPAITQTPIQTEETQRPITIFPPELIDQPTPTRTFIELLETYTSSHQPTFTSFNEIANELAPLNNLASASVTSSMPVPAPAPSLTPLTDLISASNQPDPFANYQNDLTPFTAQPVSWLWQQRLPLGGITLLDGDHGLGKSLLSLQIAAAVSSGKPMPDGSPTIQGGVIIVTPFTDPNTTQRQHLIDLGADLNHIDILSFVPNTNPHLPQNPHFPPSNTRVFSIPEDFTHLFAAIERVNAKLIIFDPFIHLLSRHHRYTKQRLSNLLTDLNHFLIDHRIACLLLRNCRAKGGHAKPTPLEKSDHFPTVAASHLLLAPDPMQPKHLLLSHALSRHCDLTPTLVLHIQPLPTNPNLAHITIQGHHTLQAHDFIAHRPDTLHRILLAQRILPIIANATIPIPATAFYAHFSTSSISQIQRALKDLVLNGQIDHPTRGFYAARSTTTRLDVTAATTPSRLDVTAATTSPSQLNHTAATTPLPTNLDVTATTTPPSSRLDVPAATTSPTNLDVTAATTTSPTNLDVTAATTPLPTNLNVTAATTTPVSRLDVTAATTSPSKLNHTAATTAPSPLNHTAATTAPSKLNHTAATTSPSRLDVPAATTSPTNLDVTAATTTTPASKLNSLAATTSPAKPPRPHKHAHKQKKSHGRPR